MNKTAFITGVTSGFGRAFAFRLASMGYRLVITGRRKERLEDVAMQLKSRYQTDVLALCFDVQKQDECIKAIDSMPDEFREIDLLVNNAGLAAGASSFEECSVDDFERMIDTNVKGLLYISKLIVPGMVERKCGHIVNISSIAGIEVYPNGSVYCGSKHAVAAITKGMRIDLVKHGIRVSSISPGMVETEFSIIRYHGDVEKANAVYAGIVPLNAEDIADALEFIVSRPAHVNILDIQINPSQQANTYVAARKQL